MATKPPTSEKIRINIVPTWWDMLQPAATVAPSVMVRHKTPGISPGSSMAMMRLEKNTCAANHGWCSYQKWM